MSEVVDILPEDAYLSVYYRDGQRSRQHITIYYDDGRVFFDNGIEARDLCHFNADELQKARQILHDCGVADAGDLSPVSAYDTAQVTWRWRLGDKSGSIHNPSYPAARHAVMDCAQEQLYELELASQERNDPR